MDPDALRPAETLMHCYAAAIAAVQPQPALRAPLHAMVPGDTSCWIIGVGKASPGMVRAIVEWLAEHGREPAGGIVVAAEAMAAPHSSLLAMAGDHPIPDARSARAANAIAALIERIPPKADVHIAISGGASALIAGPLPSLSGTDVTRTFELLISSGLDIDEMNAVRKRVTRWSAGRLALHLLGRTLHVWIISDVLGDDPGSIASGPCNGDRWRSEEVRALLTRRGLYSWLPAPVQAALQVETAKPNDPWLATILPRIVANNASALAAAVAAARTFDITADVMSTTLRGEAARMGRQIGLAMQQRRDGRAIQLWGGETTVTMMGDGGVGGRSQELALAAAHALRGEPGVLLAAGTDGRDGPTDAAGALVDGDTWDRISAAGRDPAADLARHDAYPALNAAGALLRTGPSGTNVMDLVIAATGWS